MDAGFISYRQDGGVLYDTSKVCYGLLKSGYMSLQDLWPRLNLNSIDLDPSDPSSWVETPELEPIVGFSVENAIAPIVFIVGTGSPCGSSKVGSTTKFLYTAANTSTKYYYFDVMRDDGLITGLKCFREDGTLTFNSSQVPLNVIATVQPPPPGPITHGGIYRGTPYVGGFRRMEIPYPGGPQNVINRVVVPLGTSEEYAAYVNFTRDCGLGPIIDGAQSWPFLTAQQEGAYGVVGGVGFMFCVAARSTKLPQQRAATGSSNSYFNLPTDRYPLALVIRTSDYPFPFN